MAQDNSLQFEDLLRILEQVGPSSALFEGAAKVLDSHLAPGPPRVPEATPRGAKRFLTIGMATYDDYDGVYFSAQAIRLYHPEVTEQTEILVLDNHPEGPCAAALKRLDGNISGYRYFPYDSFQSTAVRDLLIREANAEFVLAMDAHVLFAPGSLARLVEFLKAQGDSRDLWQGTLLTDTLAPIATHFAPVWSGGMFGTWALDERGASPDGRPFEIPMQGMGVCVCRKAAWPGHNPRFRGFCVEEGYLHEKVRRNGGRVLCLPFLRWLHRFDRPKGAPYRPNWPDRIRNYLIGYDELGLDAAPVVQHFEGLLSVESARPMIEAARREMVGPHYEHDAVYEIAEKRQAGEPAGGQAVGPTNARTFVPLDTPWNPEIGRVLARRSIVAEAQWQGLKSVLVLDGERSFTYRRGDFDRILEEMPQTPARVALWLRSYPDLGTGRFTAESVVHAGVVALNGNAVLLPGGSGVGKSSLVVELLRRGAVYFSDEYALIDAKGLVYPYPRPLTPRDRTGKHFPVLPCEYGATIAAEPLPAGWIVSLQHDAARGWQLEPVPQSEGLLALLRNTPQALADCPHILPAFHRVCAGARCYAGFRGDAGEAAERLVRLAG